MILPSLVAPILTVLEEPEVGPGARNTSSRVITIFTGRPDLRDSTQRQRLEVDDGLAAEAAADLGRDGADVAQLRRPSARRVMARTMNWPWLLLQIVALPSGDADEAGVRLDVALVHRLGPEAALDDDLGLGEAGLDVAQLVLELAGDVGRLALELGS